MVKRLVYLKTRLIPKRLGYFINVTGNIMKVHHLNLKE